MVVAMVLMSSAAEMWWIEDFIVQLEYVSKEGEKDKGVDDHSISVRKKTHLIHHVPK